MNRSNDLRRDVEDRIRDAFRGIKLGGGVSLRQAQAIDSRAPFPRSDSEETDDWSLVSIDELERDCVAHLDPRGLRYYIPALMLSLLSHYDGASMRVIGTLGALYPKKDDWQYHMRLYSMLDDAQKSAIAGFLAALHQLVELDFAEETTVRRALRNYWGQFLPSSSKVDQLRDFATRYAAAWCSQNPQSVASFFAPSGWLNINGGPRAQGRAAIAREAQAFMTAFPDMGVSFDRLVESGDRVQFHWTLTGTFTGPGGTGKRVHISGHEEWLIGENSLIAESRGHFDNAEYQRQLQHGAD